MIRFEIVRSDAEQPWHARVRAANGRVTWQTENYRERGSAVKAIRRMAEAFGGFVNRGGVFTYVDDAGHISTRVRRAWIVDVDERVAS